MNKTLITLFCIGLLLALISTLLPEDKLTDAEKCGTEAKRVNNVLMCKCSDNEWQKVGKCR